MTIWSASRSRSAASATIHSSRRSPAADMSLPCSAGRTKRRRCSPRTGTATGASRPDRLRALASMGSQFHPSAATRCSPTSTPRSTPCQRSCDHALEGKLAIHSAKRAYAPEGLYGERDRANRSMDIRPSASRRSDTASSHHSHASRDRPRWVCSAASATSSASRAWQMTKHCRCLLELYQWQGREEYQYRHKWRTKMLVMWDNRSLSSRRDRRIRRPRPTAPPHDYRRLSRS